MISFSIRFWGSETLISRLEGLVVKIAWLGITQKIECVFNLDNDLILCLKLKDEITEKDLEDLEDVFTDYGHYIRNIEKVIE